MNRSLRTIIKGTIAAAVMVQLLSASAICQDWVVPADSKARLSTFPFTDETRQAGERLYTLNCKSCHGTPSQGNFITTLSPLPEDPATEKYQNNTDGEIYYKVWEGRGPMPSFKNTLSPTDLWNIISYVRSFNSSYVQSVMKVITSAAYPGAVIGIKLFLDQDREKISVKATASSEEKVVPVTGASMKLFVKRTFGQMMIDEEKTTDEYGEASFSIPRELKADTSGNIMVSARFSNIDQFGDVSKDTLLQAGEKITPVSLTAQRAMWNVVRKAPVWILLTYTLGVLAVWGCIFVILFKLRDIYIIGSNLSRPPGTESKQ